MIKRKLCSDWLPGPRTGPPALAPQEKGLVGHMIKCLFGQDGGIVTSFFFTWRIGGITRHWLGIKFKVSQFYESRKLYVVNVVSFKSTITFCTLLFIIKWTLWSAKALLLQWIMVSQVLKFPEAFLFKTRICEVSSLWFEIITVSYYILGQTYLLWCSIFALGLVLKKGVGNVRTAFGSPRMIMRFQRA